MLKENIIFFYLICKNKLLMPFWKLYYFLYPINKIEFIDNNNQRYSYNLIAWKSFIVNLLSCTILKLQSIKEKLDVPVKLAKVSYTDNLVKKKIILDSKQLISYLSVNSYLNIKTVSEQQTFNNYILIKFDLNYDNQTVCLKKYAHRYKDQHNNQPMYPNTLDNIFQFKKLNIPDSALIKIVIIKKGVKKVIEMPYQTVKHEIMNFFWNL